MEAQGFFSKLIKSQSPQTQMEIKSKSSSGSRVHATSSASTINTHVAEFLRDLSLDDNPLSSPSFQSFSSLVSSSFDLSFHAKANGEYIINEEKEKNSSLESGWVYIGKFAPPPISCLKSFKEGKPYTYLSFNEDKESYVLEEIRIPNRDILRAYREDGRLKLYYDTSKDNELCEMEEEKEEDKEI